jgi:hypothetical protein
MIDGGWDRGDDRHWRHRDRDDDDRDYDRGSYNCPPGHAKKGEC